MRNLSSKTPRSRSQIARLKNDLTAKDQKLESLSARLKSTSENNGNLPKHARILESSMNDLQKKLRETQGLLQASIDEKAGLPEKLTELKNSLNEVQTSYVADEIKIRELTEQLDEKTGTAERNAQLLERDRDIRDLMTARNLHIYDVFDTDAKGKTKPAFGRIFYTEGKSLVFYAYDLNETKLANANYHYRVWGGQEGQKDKVASLGVFYSDDKTQRRWVFKCNNPENSRTNRFGVCHARILRLGLPPPKRPEAARCLPGRHRQPSLAFPLEQINSILVQSSSCYCIVGQRRSSKSRSQESDLALTLCRARAVCAYSRPLNQFDGGCARFRNA